MIIFDWLSNDKNFNGVEIGKFNLFKFNLNWEIILIFFSLILESGVNAVRIISSNPDTSTEEEEANFDDFVKYFLGGDEVLTSKSNLSEGLELNSAGICTWFKMRQSLSSTAAILTIAATEWEEDFGLAFVSVTGKPNLESVSWHLSIAIPFINYF